MQNVSTDFNTAIDNSYSLYTLPKVIAEFNMNMIYTVQSVTNLGSDVGADDEYYPIKSIVQANRPHAGMAKAKIGKSNVSKFGEVRQFRTVSEDAVYKYWSTDGVSANSVTSGYYAITGVSPAVVYSQNVPCNKIRVTFENSWSAPASYSIYITHDGTTWQQISSNPSMTSFGVVDLYLQNSGSWTTTENLENSTTIRGVGIVVSGMTKPKSRLELIEISARLRKDLSDDVIDIEIDKELANVSLVAPLGESSANTASVTLDNSNNQYVSDNVDSPYHNLLKKNVRLEYYLGINPVGYNATGIEWVKQGVFYVDSWGNEDDYTVQVSSTDFSKFLQQQKLVPTLYRNRKAGQLIRGIFNTIGYNNVVEAVAKDALGNTIQYTDYVLPYFWVTKTDMAWDLIQQICQATQSAVYFDEDENLVYVSRNVITGNKYVNDQFRGQKETAGLADIINISHEHDVQVNKVTVNYKPLDVTKDKNGVRRPTTVWTAGQTDVIPDSKTTNGITTTTTNNLQSTTDTGAVSIVAAYLAQDLNSSDMIITVDQSKVPIFPFESYLNVDGEIMHYKGKRYKYYPNNNFTPSYTTVYSMDDVLNVDNNKSNQFMRIYNDYTGGLVLVDRGMWGSRQKAHNNNISGWTFGHMDMSKPASFSSGNAAWGQYKSTIRLQGSSQSDWYLGISPATEVTTNHVVGTEVFFPKGGSKMAFGGMVMNLQSNNHAGIYILIGPSDVIGTEIAVWRVNNDGTKVLIEKKVAAIARQNWYQLDAMFDAATGGYNVFINGDLRFSFTDTTFSNGRAGIVSLGDSTVYFEYFYTTSDDTPPSGDYDPRTAMKLNRITGDYETHFVNRQIMFDKVYNKKKKKHLKYTLQFFDDFGPWVHEMRKFDIQYQNSPVIGPFIYCSNDLYADVLRFRPNAFGATFFIVNMNRASVGTTGLAVIQGKDYEYFTGNEIDQTTTINGFVLTSGDQKTIEITNDDAISDYGVNELTFDSPWLQTTAEANDVANWVVTNWGTPIETISVDLWIHPAIQLGDVVTINYPKKGFDGTISYRVSKISIGWSSGGLSGTVEVVKIP